MDIVEQYIEHMEKYLPPDILEKYAYNIKKSNLEPCTTFQKEYIGHPARTLSSSFTWGSTPEGADYWLNIFTKLEKDIYSLKPRTNHCKQWTK